MISWLAKQYFAFAMRRLNAGDPGPAMWLDAPDVEFTFPGANSWSGVIRGKAELRTWLERFVKVGLQSEPDEVVVKGFPWRQAIAIRARDHADSPEGERVYENRYVIWGELRWGRLIRYEVYEDTEKSAAFDGWLSENEHRLGVAA